MIPGYSGHVPRLQNDVGRSFGKATRELSPPRPATASTQTRSTSSSGMYHIPGYRGYVPNMVNSFEHTYADSTRAALQELGSTTRGYEAYPPRDRYLTGRGFSLPRDIPETHRPSTAGAALQTRAVAVDSASEGKPIPGYTGYIPTLREARLERTFGRAVSSAIEVSRSARSMRSTGGAATARTAQPAAVARPATAATTTDASTARRRDSESMEAMMPKPSRIPGYQGYVPGAIQSIGNTYGRSVQQAFDGVSDRATVPGVMDPVGKVRRALPGYSGHIPQFKEQFGRSYTRMLQAATQ